ncbi:hydroxymethylglutaryl-CoA synthase [Flavobacteriaceae bacterium]|nr:hydroxymethylglutaryl-CoA synthase [Flavobacteriaceae bacterium]
MNHIGIDAIAFYVPDLYLPIKDLAEKRDIPFEKLNKGLGLEKMAIADINEDAAAFCANALVALFEKNNIDPREIGRIYLGSESALDSSKPTATYAVEILEKKLAQQYGERSLKNCDVTDMTFACIGGVDALQNSLDWVRCGRDRKAIVVASDLSKYELNSTGEYTQGAGAVALLITQNPSILAIEETWGVATKSESDFFKPRRSFQKSEVLKELIEVLDIKDPDATIPQLLSQSDFWQSTNELIEIYKEEPVFDGQYSNSCYDLRMKEALEHFNAQRETNFLQQWAHIIFHLPYAYHGRRIIFQTWLEWLKANQDLKSLIDEIGAPADDLKEWNRKAVKSELYKQFVAAKIADGEKASSQIGNMYTASIFMSLLSMLSEHHAKDHDICGDKVGFIAYGSGSKAKVFEGTIQQGWKQKVGDVALFEVLSARSVVSIEDYEHIHRNELKQPLTKRNTRLIFKETGANNLGYRRYENL